MSESSTLSVEVAYALAQRQKIVPLEVQQGTTAMQAAMRSGLDQLFLGLDVSRCKMGIFSKVLDGKVLPLPQDYVLKAGDRVEIYRGLLVDPKEVRAKRALKAKEKAQAKPGKVV